MTALPVRLRAFAEAGTVAKGWMAVNWLVWAALWLLYFLLLAMKRPIERLTAWFTLLTGVFTGWLPGFLMIERAI